MQWRLVIVFINFLGLAINYGARASMGIAMTWEGEGSLPMYNRRGIVLGAFLIGYAGIQVPSGILTRHVGARPLLLLSALTLALFDMFTPALAAAGLGLLVLCRVGVGVGCGLLVPAQVQILAAWIPGPEKASRTTFVVSGASLGPILAMTLTPQAISAFGVPAAFQLWGSLSAVWLCAVLCLVTSVPAEHRRCCDSGEAAHIQRQLPTVTAADRPVPLSLLLQTPSCWGIIAGQVGFDFGWQLLLNWLPSYLVQPGIGLDLAERPLLAALPYACGWLGVVTAGWVSDALLRSKALRLRRRHVRKVVQLFGAGGGALLLLASATAAEPRVALAALLASLFCYQWQMAGFIVSVLDVCPSDAGPFMGIANTISMLAGACAQPAVDAILAVTGSWVAAFATAGSISLGGAAVFAALADDQDISRRATPTAPANAAWQEYAAVA